VRLLVRRPLPVPVPVPQFSMPGASSEHGQPRANMVFGVVPFLVPVLESAL